MEVNVFPIKVPARYPSPSGVQSRKPEGILEMLSRNNFHAGCFIRLDDPSVIFEEILFFYYWNRRFSDSGKSLDIVS